VLPALIVAGTSGAGLLEQDATAGRLTPSAGTDTTLRDILRRRLQLTGD
jgi:hypothetical protein